VPIDRVIDVNHKNSIPLPEVELSIRKISRVLVAEEMRGGLDGHHRYVCLFEDIVDLLYTIAVIFCQQNVYHI